MSFHTYYQAIPEQSHLFHRLRSERAFNVLYCQLTLLGPGPFHMTDLDAIDRDLAADVFETLAWLAEEEPAFASRAVVDRTLAELQKELAQAMTAHPGLETRAAYIEQVHDELEELLIRELQRKGHASADSLVKTWLYGDMPLAPALFGPSELQLTLVPASMVQEGAQALAAIHGAMPAPDGEEWDPLDEHYNPWRRLYLRAARLGEAIVVLGS